ncbi:hypothetical protein [Colwellia echini]|uniref:EpsG family protein n=1 Tax=Colwellia echini TaxID=1982103 RepID=A0ABY3MVT2_9GAMM|nr:hypothetical protein [Colwellia echini]TYK65328.1 hypothetical protein CWS31_010695 [Colwellia echini]
MKLYLPRLTLKKQPVYISVLAVIVFMSTSTGFDFYSHAVAYYFYDMLLYNADLLLGEIVLPRYWLLSYLYEITSRIGIPIGFVSLFLIVFPVYSIVSSYENTENDNGLESYSLVELFSFLLLIIISFFYSGASLASLWFLALLKTKKTVFLVGGLLHPIGIILFGIGSLILNYKIFIRFVILLFLVMSFFYVCTYFSLFTSSIVQSPRFEISLDNVVALFDFAINKKGKEIIGVGVVTLLFVLSKGVLIQKINILQQIRISKTYSNLMLFLFVSAIVLFMANKNSLIKSIRTISHHDVIYIAWFDWGDKDLKRKETPWTLTSKRYIY